MKKCKSFTKVEKQLIPKPYLGGWRHKVTGTDYLNATTQTGPFRKRIWENTCSRLVQTAKLIDKATHMLPHHATQMWRSDCYIPNVADKYMTVRPYETYFEMQLRLDFDGNARKIQRYYRAYRLMKYVRKYAQIYRELIKDCRQYEEEKAMAYKMRHKRNILRQIYPRSKADFDMLYSLIEKWRIARLKIVKSQMFKAGNCAENYYGILRRTVDMFNQIDRHKQAMKNAQRKRKTLKFLTVNCKPIRWNGYKGIPVEMVTVKIQKARELKGVYDALGDRDMPAEERIKLLTTLKKSLDEHRCVEGFDLLSLLDQELVLLNRRIKNFPRDCLNERLMHTYLKFVSLHGACGCVDDEQLKDEKCELRQPLETRTKFCRNCLKLVPHDKFFSHTRLKKLSVCIGCNSLSERNIAHVDYDPYMFILNCVRADEDRRKSTSALAFLMQQHDIYHLINNIWHGRSAVSKNMDLFRLRLIRYWKDVEWAPWNCILLTQDEADLHYRIDDPATVYSKYLTSQIHLAHQIAKNQFKQLLIIDKEFRESSEFSAIQANGKRYKPLLTVQDYDASEKYKS